MNYKFFIMAAMLFCLPFAFTACENDDENLDNFSPVGKWIAKNDDPDVLENYAVFNPNNTGISVIKYIEYGKTYTETTNFTWTYNSKNKVITIYDEDGYVDEVKVISNNKFKIVDEDGYVMYANRQ